SENKGALSVIRKRCGPPTSRFISQLESIRHSGCGHSSADAPTNDAINSAKNGGNLKLRGDDDLHLQSLDPRALKINITSRNKVHDLSTMKCLLS
ncbi:hypothetical protein ALC60_13933, partial [Trachymyrmex zeteki]